MYKLIFILFGFILSNIRCEAQSVNGFQLIDSLSYQQYLKEDWDNLLNTGKLAKKQDIVYPNLSLRLGYAALMNGNNSLSLKHYQDVLKLNSYQKNALYFCALNNLSLIRRDVAIYIANKLSSDEKKLLNLSTKKAIEFADFEISVKPSSTETRKTGQYYRIGFGNRINYRWKLYHSFAMYRQVLLAPDTTTIFPRRNGPPVRNNFRNFLVNDFQYFLKSEYFLSEKVSLTNTFHFIKTNFDGAQFNTSIFNVGLKYFMPFADVKLEVNAGPLIDSLLTQVAFSSTYFPSGNNKFYGNSRLSFQRRTNLSQLNFYQMLGLKIGNKLWLEMNCTLGQIKNLIDNDAFYIYDAMDAGNYRIGTSLIIPFNEKVSLLTNYYFEQKKLLLQNNNYNLHSFTTGISWKL